MAKTVIWKNKASLQLREVLTFLRNQYSQRTAEAFLEKVFERLDRIQKFPETGQPLQRFKNVRRLRVGKNHYLVYRIFGQNIAIIFVWDNRMDPAKNPYR